MKFHERSVSQFTSIDDAPPPPINFVYDLISIYLVLFRVMLG